VLQWQGAVHGGGVAVLMSYGDWRCNRLGLELQRLTTNLAEMTVGGAGWWRWSGLVRAGTAVALRGGHDRVSGVGGAVAFQREHAGWRVDRGKSNCIAD
jgi:hypothetical protein